ncbi:MAG: septal ring lytic transglycosylase RlpA family protein [Spirochaetaceae bacterium]
MLTRRLSILCIVVLLSATGVTYPQAEEGLASWYGGKFHGRLTANGEVFDTNELTAAHKTLPFGTLVKVTHIGDGRSVVVRINDRGPFVEGRIIDLSRAAADAIGLTARGVAPVHIEVVHAVQPVAFRDIQVGSFSVRANAEALRDRLEEAGFSPILESSTARRHRVLIQQVPLEQIEAHRERLGAIGIHDVLIREP